MSSTHNYKAPFAWCKGCKVSSRNQLLTKTKAEAEVKVYPGAPYFFFFFFSLPPALPRATKSM